MAVWYSVVWLYHSVFSLPSTHEQVRHHNSFTGSRCCEKHPGWMCTCVQGGLLWAVPERAVTGWWSVHNFSRTRYCEFPFQEFLSLHSYHQHARNDPFHFHLYSLLTSELEWLFISIRCVSLICDFPFPGLCFLLFGSLVFCWFGVRIYTSICCLCAWCLTCPRPDC